MYKSILIIIYSIVIIIALTHFIRHRDIPSSRRWSIGLGIAGILIAPAIALFICELLTSILSIVILVMFFIFGFGVIFRIIFH